MRVIIRKGKKGDFVGEPFCIIHRDYQAGLKEGDEWEVEVIREIIDRKGNRVPIVKPVRRIEEVEKLFGGSVVIRSGKNTYEPEEKEKKKAIIRRKRGTLYTVEVITTAEYYWKGKKVGERSYSIDLYFDISDEEDRKEIVENYLPIAIEGKELLSEEGIREAFREAEEIRKKEKEKFEENINKVLSWTEKIKAKLKEYLENCSSEKEKEKEKIKQELEDLKKAKERREELKAKIKEIPFYLLELVKVKELERGTLKVRKLFEYKYRYRAKQNFYDGYEVVSDKGRFFVLVEHYYSFGTEGDRDSEWIFTGIGIGELVEGEAEGWKKRVWIHEDEKVVEEIKNSPNYYVYNTHFEEIRLNAGISEIREYERLISEIPEIKEKILKLEKKLEGVEKEIERYKRVKNALKLYEEGKLPLIHREEDWAVIVHYTVNGVDVNIVEKGVDEIQGADLYFSGMDGLEDLSERGRRIFEKCEEFEKELFKLLNN